MSSPTPRIFRQRAAKITSAPSVSISSHRSRSILLLRSLYTHQQVHHLPSIVKSNTYFVSTFSPLHISSTLLADLDPETNMVAPSASLLQPPSLSTDTESRSPGVCSFLVVSLPLRTSGCVHTQIPITSSFLGQVHPLSRN